MATTNTLREWRATVVSRDVLFEILRGSSALAYLSGTILEQNIDIDGILARKLGQTEVQTWVRDFQNHLNELRRAQVLLSRDLNTLFDQAKDQEILRLLSSYDNNFQNLKSIQSTTQKRIGPTYVTTQRHLPYPGQSPAQGNEAQLESIRQSLAYRNPQPSKPSSTPQYTTSATYSRTTVQQSTTVIQQGSTDSGPVVTPARDVLIQQSRHYSIKNKDGFSAQYTSPDEGFVQTLDENQAISTDRLTTNPSSYIRVIKEYKGEEYILKGGRTIRNDGSRSPTPIRQSIKSSSKSPTTVNRNSADYTQMTRTDYRQNTAYTPHTSAVNKDLFKDDPKQEKLPVIVSKFDPVTNNQRPASPQPSPTPTYTPSTPTYKPANSSYQPYQAGTQPQPQPLPQSRPNQPETMTFSKSPPQQSSPTISLRLKQPRTIPALADDHSGALPTQTTQLTASEALDMVSSQSKMDKPIKIDISSLREDGR